MVIGPGKYDAQCTAAREATKARGVVLIVIDGEKGAGFEVQAPMDVQLALPALLRQVADGIEAELMSTARGRSAGKDA